ncbi:MAG TPA: ABC transporter permease [Firmicutes bacterium]|nr:ABC transporter permease [Candidatus Fermentithermobacillaceae bacterium]
MSTATISTNLTKRRLREFAGAFMRNRQAVIGLSLLTFILLVAILAPVLAPYDPYALIGNLLEAPSKAHPMGTDNLGRDVLSRVIYGTRVSLLIGTIAAALSGILGTSIGATAGFFGGKTDAILSEVIDIVLMIPTFFLILIVVALMGSNMLNVMVVIGLTSWPGNARLMRSQALSLRTRTFVQAARATGESEWRILFRYIIPNGIFPVVSNTTMQVATAILTEASLSFLGLGDPNLVSWGQMIFNGRTYISSAWWVAAFPGIAIVITVAAFYMIGDGLNKVLNPKLRS